MNEWADERASLACAGDALFQTHENLEHLAMMEQVLGPLPESMVERSNKAASKCFVGNRWGPYRCSGAAGGMALLKRAGEVTPLS
jgi:hypothetical protein